jgi:hypothetical protein
LGVLRFRSPLRDKEVNPGVFVRFRAPFSSICGSA